MKRKRPWWHRLLLYAGSAFAFYIGLCFYLAGLYLSPHRSVPGKPKSLVSVSVTPETPAWSTSASNLSDVVFVFAHGYGGDRGHWVDIARQLRAKGYDSVIPAMPGQDASGIKNVGFGLQEAEVLRDTYEWARQSGAKRIVAVGVSMGGSAVWLSTRLDNQVDAIVTEGAYARFDRAMSSWLDYAVPNGSVTLRPVVWIASARSGIDPGSINPEEAAAEWSGPALVIQAQNDALISSWHAERLAKAAKSEIWQVPGAQHANCFIAAEDEYLSRLLAIAKVAAK